jgi:hypothetical protein
MIVKKLDRFMSQNWGELALGRSIQQGLLYLISVRKKKVYSLTIQHGTIDNNLGSAVC